MSQKWKVIVAFVGVFLAGIVCGEPLSEWYQKVRAARRPAFAVRTMERYERELRLTAEQKEKINPILNRAQDEWRQLRQENVRNLIAVVDRMHAEVAAELTPDQQQKLEIMRQELRARTERLRGRVHDTDGAGRGERARPPSN